MRYEIWEEIIANFPFYCFLNVVFCVVVTLSQPPDGMSPLSPAITVVCLSH